MWHLGQALGEVSNIPSQIWLHLLPCLQFLLLTSLRVGRLWHMTELLCQCPDTNAWLRADYPLSAPATFCQENQSDYKANSLKFACWIFDMHLTSLVRFRWSWCTHHFIEIWHADSKHLMTAQVSEVFMDVCIMYASDLEGDSQFLQAFNCWLCRGLWWVCKHYVSVEHHVNLIQLGKVCLDRCESFLGNGQHLETL